MLANRGMNSRGACLPRRAGNVTKGVAGDTKSLAAVSDTMMLGKSQLQVGFGDSWLRTPHIYRSM
jgi:hypothetical protein